MPEPTSAAAATVTMVAGTVSIPVLTILGVPLGLRADLLIAGFFGSLVAGAGAGATGTGGNGFVKFRFYN